VSHCGRQSDIIALPCASGDIHRHVDFIGYRRFRSRRRHWPPAIHICDRDLHALLREFKINLPTGSVGLTGKECNLDV